MTLRPNIRILKIIVAAKNILTLCKEVKPYVPDHLQKEFDDATDFLEKTIESAKGK